jgi:hypothetical protein
MKLVRTEDAAGHVLCHDVTQIVIGVTKDARFRKGQVVAPEDIPVLLSLGKEHLYIWENDETKLHEDEAAEILRGLCQGGNMRATAPKEGKIELLAEADGLFMADKEKLLAINSLGEIIIATRPTGLPVKKGERLCGTRVIPLVIEKSKMAEAARLAGNEPLLRLLPIRRKKYGLVTTGNEVFHGRIEDRFSDVVREKLSEFGCAEVFHAVTDDDAGRIAAAIQEALDAGAELVVCTGGMSVDPDDRTPLAIRNSGAGIVSYGAPTLPGAMFLMAYMPDGRAVCGLPGCVMYSKRTIFDLVLPRLLADVPVTAEWLAGLGDGGLCLNCAECRFPNCGFTKGA